MFATRLVCKGCGADYPLDARFACDQCFGPLEAAYDDEAIARSVTREQIVAGPSTLWRYAALPARRAAGARPPVGDSPLIAADRLAEELGLRCKLYIKTETSNPTHSFKDRVVAVAAAKAVELGFEALGCASTGNLAGATRPPERRSACRPTSSFPTTWSGRRSWPPRPTAQRSFEVNGTYDDVNRLCSELAYDRPWAFVNVNLRPYYAEGSKTVALRDGGAARLAGARPRRGADRLGLAVHQDPARVPGGARHRPGRRGAGGAGDARGPGRRVRAGGDRLCLRRQRRLPVRPTGIAKSLAIGNPADGVFAVGVARETGGAIEAADDDEIVEGIRLLARTTGIFTETAGGVTTAILRKIAERGEISPDETVVAYITGDGLKTIDAIEPSVETVRIEADPDQVEAYIDARITA